MNLPKPLAKKLDRIADEISKEKGELSVLALVMPNGWFGSWELVVAAPWMGKDSFGVIGYIGKKLKKHLSKRDLKLISRIAPVDEDHPLREALEQIEARALGLRLTSFHIQDLEIQEAHVIRPKMAA